MASPSARPQVHARLLEWDGVTVTSPLKPRQPAAPIGEDTFHRRPASSSDRGSASATGRALADAIQSASWTPDAPASPTRSAASRPQSASERVRDVSLRAAEAIERAASIASSVRPESARQLSRRAREIDNVIFRLDSASEAGRSDAGRSPYPAAPGSFEDPEMRYLVNDLDTMQRSTMQRYGSLDAPSSRASSSREDASRSVTPSAAMSAVSSTAALAAEVEYTRDLRERVRGGGQASDLPEEYSEAEAAEDKAYCQRIRRQLRYTFGPLEPVQEAPRVLPAMPVEPAEPPAPVEDDWAKQMLEELYARGPSSAAVH